MYRTPVGNDGALKAPFVLENFSEELTVLRAPDGIHLVVGAHYRIRLCLFDGYFKAAQIYLAHCSFVDFNARVKAVLFLIVERVVLRTGADAFLFETENEFRSKLARDDGVLRIIFKISAAESVSLYVHAGTQNRRHAVARTFGSHSLAKLS